MKKASSRSHRGSKGIKVKHVLQICVLVGVCIWLIYQVKYSHDKKKQFYEKDVKKSIEDGVVKLGRKDLLPGYHNQKENEKHVKEAEDEEEISHGGEDKEKKSVVENSNQEEEEDEEENEEEKSKQEEEEVTEKDEEENTHEEDEIDEQDHTDKDDELLEEEKETNHIDEIDKAVDEVREEHYKADDASSAVSHESRILNTEELNKSFGNSNETARENNSNGTTSNVEVQKEPDLKLGETKSAGSLDKTTTEVQDADRELPSFETKRVVTESQGDTVNGNSTEAILEASRFLQNETEIMRDRSQENGALPVGISDLNVTVSANITRKDFIQDESRNSTSESSLVENISDLNTTEVKENSRSKTDDESGKKESSNLFSSEQTENLDFPRRDGSSRRSTNSD